MHGDGTDGLRSADPRSDARLLGWVALVGGYAALAYYANFSSDGEPADDVFYRWSTAVAAAVLYGFILGLVVALSRGVGRDVLGLRRPRAWWRALGLVAAAFVAVLIIAALLNPVLEAGEEQGLVPEEWDSTRAAPFVANFLVVAALAPMVEELTYRGLGFGLTRARFGVWPAIAITSLAFGLGHGLVIALPILTLFGVVLALVRERTQSLYPAVLLHAIFNAVALLAPVIQDAAA